MFVMVARSLLPPDDDEVGTDGFARQCVARQIQRRSPFGIRTIRADDAAEPVSLLRERLVHFLDVGFRSQLLDRVFRKERRRNGVGRETYQGGIEFRSKLRGYSNSL